MCYTSPMGYYIAVDIGGTQIRAACYPSSGLEHLCLARTTTRPTAESPSPATAQERLMELIASVWPPDGEVTAITVAAPGPTNPYTGVVFRAPNIPAWRDLPLAQELRQRFYVPAAVGNDANLAALAEWKYGAGRGHHHLLYLTISTGIGGGIIVDDRLLLGFQGLAAELGHITVIPDGPLCGCGHRGHLEALASGPAIAHWVEEERSQGAPTCLPPAGKITAKMVAEAARKGDELSIAALARAGHFIGQALADFLHIFNPSIVVLGGGVSRSGELLLQPIRDAMPEHLFSPHYLDGLELATAQFADEVGLVGALALGRTLHPALDPVSS